MVAELMDERSKIFATYFYVVPLLTFGLALFATITAEASFVTVCSLKSLLHKPS
jgi:hypothetical protein